MERKSYSLQAIREFTISDSSRFPLKGTNGNYWHHGTILYGVREFIVIFITMTGQMAIEEVTGGHLEAISDDDLWMALAQFAANKGLNQIQCRK